MNQEQVVVIGGGLAGLSCAVALADLGLKVTVLEAAAGLGGRASSWQHAASGDVVDIGPHIFQSEYHNMLAFLERLGTSRLITWQPDKVLTIASMPRALALEHAPLPAPMSLMPSIFEAPGLHMGDYLSMGPTAMRGMEFGEEEVEELDAVSALDFLRKEGVSEEMIDWWWRFAAMVVANVPPQQLFDMLPPSLTTQAPFAAFDSFEPSPYISCYLWFDRDLQTERFFAHKWSPRRLNYDFYDLCQIRHGWQGRPTVIASNIIYSHRAHGMTDEEIVRETVGEIAEFAPLAAQAKVVHADIHRIPMAIPCPTVGFERKRPAARSPVSGLVLAGDWTRTHMPCTMEGAVKSGFTAAEEVLAERGEHLELAIPARTYDGIAGMVRSAAAGKRGVSPLPE